MKCQEPVAEVQQHVLLDNESLPMTQCCVTIKTAEDSEWLRYRILGKGWSNKSKQGPISVVKDDQASKEEQMAELTKWKDYEVFEEGPRLKEKFAISSESSSTFRYLDLQIVQEDRKATVDQSHYMKLTLMQDPVQRS